MRIGHDALVKVLGVFEHQIFQAAEFFLADFQVFAGVLDLLQFFDALFELDHLGGDARELLHQRRDLAGAERKLFQQLHAAAAAAADGQAQLVLILLALGFAQAVPVVAVAAEHLADRFEVQRNALADGALVGLVLGGADFHRAVEGEIAVIDLLENFHGRLKAVIAFQHLASGKSCG